MFALIQNHFDERRMTNVEQASATFAPQVG